jgi:hypothetical protein
VTGKTRIFMQHGLDSRNDNCPHNVRRRQAHHKDPAKDALP